MGQSTTVIPTGGGGAKVQDSIPTNPQKGDLWVDTSNVISTVKWYDGTEFLPVEARIGSVTDESELPSNIPAQIFYDNSSRTYKRSLPDDIGSASYTGTNINTYGSNPSDITWKPDGSRFFELEDSIIEYDVTTEWDISTASYTGTSLPTQDFSDGFAWKPDGSLLFEIGKGNNKIYEYDVTTEWDISTASYTGTSINTQNGFPRGITWKPDGSRLFELGKNGGKIYEYDVTTEWDISTASYTGTSLTLVDGNPFGIDWKPDGSRFFQIGQGSGDKIYEYDVTTEWDISTASYTGISISTQDDRPAGIELKPDGSLLFEIGYGLNKIYEYDLPKYETF